MQVQPNQVTLSEILKGMVSRRYLCNEDMRSGRNPVRSGATKRFSEEAAKQSISWFTIQLTTYHHKALTQLSTVASENTQRAQTVGLPVSRQGRLVVAEGTRRSGARPAKSEL